MSNKYSYFLLGLALALGASTPASGEEFYKGKTLQFIVGFSPGGGYDTYTRLIARHISKYIPGNPTPIVQNMTGAGSLIAANYIAKRARPDGLTGAIFNNSLTDGIYDPGSYNDRLLLGLKGTMSEAELHILKARMQAGRLAKARRGELALALPMGYLRRPSGEVVLDPA